MASEDISDKNSEEFDWGKQPIKEYSLEQVEEAISNAISELTGSPHEAKIKKLDLAPEPNSWIDSVSHIELTLTNKKYDI